jgi:hypothetical protein
MLTTDKVGINYKLVALLDVLFPEFKLDIVYPDMQGFELYPHASL